EIRAAIKQTQEAWNAEEVLLAILEEEEKTLQNSFQKQDSALQDLRHAVQTQIGQVSELRLQAETMRERLVGKEREAENAKSRLDAFEDRSRQIQEEQSETQIRLGQLAVVQKE